MPKYVIVRSDGMFVADMRKSPSGRSYTNKLQYAKTYDTAESAALDR